MGRGSTLSKVIYNLLLDQFDCCAFLPDIQEESRQKGLEFLWNRLVSQLLKVNLPESHGTVANEGRFSAKEVLILLDDVSEVNQLDALVGKGSRFDRRSRILITTRNTDIRNFILDFSVVNRSYELSGMGFDQSLTLFSRHAFGSDYPLDEYAEYSKRAIEISGGHPLALEVIASFTKKKKNVIDSFPSTKRRVAWERSLKMLEEVPHEDIQKRFGIILNDLTNQQMQIFLDIAFYFIGVDERIAIHMWDGQLFPEAAIEKLHPSSLIKIADNKLWMHNLIRDIARKNSRASNDRPGEQSRWCNHGEALKMLEEKKGTETVEGLALDFDSTYPYCLTPDEFRCLPNLRFLQLNGMKLAGNFRGLLQKLRWLNWHRRPSDVLPTYLDLSSVTVLDLSWGTISEKWGGWHHIETAVRLKVMILMGCSKLTRTPNFSAFPALERVILKHCEELIEFHTSLGRLKHLVSLNLRECTYIKGLPEELFSLESLEELLVDGTLIREIRILSGSLTKLQTFSASGCTDLTQVHSSIGSLESLLELLLDNTKITELPYSIGSLSKLKVLSLRHCRHLSKLPESIEQLALLVELDLSNTGIIELPASIGKLKCLNVLGLDGRLRDMESRLQEIFRTKDLLNLEVSAGYRSTLNQDAKRLPSSSLEEPCFVGRKKEENKIIQLLTRDESHTIPTIISIVGMGGIGKTTLAQRVYNDVRVTQHFEIKAWTCVSDDFDVFGITRAILQSISHLPCEGKDLNWLQVNLKENLLGKKFLIVLDDIWNEKYGEWTTLLKPLKSGAKESKVIITTRIFNTASIAGGPVYRLNGLQEDVCLALFTYHAFGVNNFDHHSHLQEIGEKLVHKCRGLPLAAKTLGGLLRTKVEPSEWEAILNSKLWDFLEGRDEILPALKLSYVHLPFHLKRCFAYCAIFPKDYETKRDKLIHWWMAEGFLGENNGKNRWDIGLNYFNELVSRSFFQQGKGSRYFMHDFIHDLAMSISGETCFSAQELESEAYENNVSLARARYASFVSKHYVTSEKLKRYHGMKKLRSFVTLQDLPVPNYISQKALHELVSELKNVRVFSMSHHHIIEVPNSICELKHLHHLDFSYTSIQTLPKSIGSIYNLEALLLRGCKRLSELPREIEKLYNLQYLDIRETPNLRAMPGNLANLKILLGFVMGTQKGSGLKELKHLIHLEGKLFISELQRVEVVGDAKDVNLHEKRGIGKLVWQWAQDFNDSRNKEHENVVLEFLQPHINLKIIRISYYCGTIFPSWLGSALYTSIVHVDVCGCHNVTSLPSLGQLPSLKQLHIEGLNSITKVGNELKELESIFFH